MERNPYIDRYNDNDISWAPRQEQIYERSDFSESWDESPRQEQVYERSDFSESWDESPRQEQYQKIQPARMPREEVQSLVRRLKQGLLISSIVGFGAMSWLVTFRQVAASFPQTPTQQFQQSVPSDSSRHFFNQSGRNPFGEHHHHRRDFRYNDHDQDDGGSYQGSTSQSQDTVPVSSTHVS